MHDATNKPFFGALPCARRAWLRALAGVGLLMAATGVGAAPTASATSGAARKTPGQPSGKRSPASAKPVPVVRGQFLTSDRVRLSYLFGGKASALTPLVFVPGWSMPAELFRPHLQRLSASRRVWALDPRGHGHSEAPETGYDADRRARDLFEFIGRLKQPPVVIAWSLAGVEMLHGLRHFGESRLAALVLVDSSLGEGPASNGEAVAAFREQIRADRQTQLAGFARAIFRQPLSDEAFESLVADMSRVPLQASLDMLDYRLPRESLRESARGFKKPLLIAYTPQYQAQVKLHAEARPHSRLELFEDAGHALFADQPKRFDEMIESFAQSVDPKPAKASSSATKGAKKSRR